MISACTTTKKVIGRSNGIVMKRSRCQKPAPSIWAASYTPVGSAWRAVRYRIALKPMFFQTVRRVSAPRASQRSCSQSGPWMPKPSRKVLTKPEGSSMYRQTIAAATDEVTTGKKYTLR